MTENKSSKCIETLPYGCHGVTTMEEYRAWLMNLPEFEEFMKDLSPTIISAVFNHGHSIMLWDMRGAKGYER